MFLFAFFYAGTEGDRGRAYNTHASLFEGVAPNGAVGTTCLPL